MSVVDSPVDLPTPAKRGLGVWRTLLLCGVFYAVFVGVISVEVLCLQTVAAFRGDTGPLKVSLFFSMLVPQIVAWAVTIRIGLDWTGSSFREAVPLRSIPWRIVPAIVVTSFGAAIVLIAASALIPTPQWMREALANQWKGSGLLMTFLPMVIIAPFAEEAFFRGLVLRAYQSRATVTQAVRWSAILFAVFHLNPWQAVVALPLGVWYARMAVRTGSVLPGMMSHAVVNFSAAFLLSPLASAFGGTVEELERTEGFPPLMVGLGAVLAAAGGYVLWRQMARIELAPPLAEPVAPGDDGLLQRPA